MDPEKAANDNQRLGGMAASSLSGWGLVTAFALNSCGDAKGTCGQQKEHRWRLTYTKFNPLTGRTYSGRASGWGVTPQDVLTQRDFGHHKTAQGFGPAVLDRYLNVDGAINDAFGYAATRGREQMLIEHFGGAQSVGGNSGNDINGIRADNPRKGLYIGAAIASFGPLEGTEY